MQTYNAMPILPSHSQTSLEDGTGDNFCLEDFSAASCLLHVDHNYILVSKPPKVRMDGEFNVSLQKLLLAWIPGSTLETLKWVHQLDYATSGILCVARNKAAAALASAAFEERGTSKQYLAVVEGHVDPNKWPLYDKNQPLLNAPSLDRKGGKRSHVGVHNQGLAPESHSITPTWQETVMHQTLQANLTALHSHLKARREMGAEVEEPLKPFSNPQGCCYEELVHDSKRRKLLRKALTTCGIISEDVPASIAPTSTVSAPAHNQSEVEKTNQFSDERPRTLLFHEACETGIFRECAVSSEDSESRKEEMQIYINMNVAEVPGDFRCEIGHVNNPGKLSETRVRILKLGYHRGRPVTKVLLLPFSGRRHQLRVHCRALGHPIVGDYTYGLLCSKEEERMMLHAYKLVVKVPRSARGHLHRARYQEMGISADLDILAHGEAPDPFDMIVQEKM